MFGADDGIRTRDPNVGNVVNAVQPGLAGAATWGLVQPVVRSVRLFPPCSRALYFGSGPSTTASC